MSHNIDITEDRASFVTAREDAWHSLGITLPDAFTAEEAMEHGLLGDWNVRKAPLFTYPSPDALPLQVPGRYSVLRDNPVTKGQVDIIGECVGESYKIIQNEEHAALLNALVDESGAHFETAGALDGGKRVFITMKLPGHIAVGGVDPIEQYLAAVNSHDGSMAFTMMVTPVRIVCANTMNLAFQQHSHQFRVRHTSGAQKGMVSQARQALDMTFKYLDGFKEEAERLINTTLTQARFEEIISEEFGAGDDAAPATVTRADKKIEEMSELFSDAFTQKGVRGTAWAGLNALTEWYDHFSPVRGDDHDTSRAIKAIMDPGFKNRALDLMLNI